MKLKFLLILPLMFLLDLQTAIFNRLNASPPAGVEIQELPDFDGSKDKPFANSRITIALQSIARGNGQRNEGYHESFPPACQMEINPYFEFILEARSYRHSTTGILAMEKYIRELIYGFMPEDVTKPLLFVSMRVLEKSNMGYAYSLIYGCGVTIFNEYDPAADPALDQLDLNYTPTT